MKWSLLQVALVIVTFFNVYESCVFSQAIENHQSFREAFSDHDHERCGIKKAIERQSALDPNFEREVRDFVKNGVPQLSKIEAGRSVAPIITIPVVVHIIHSGEAEGSGSNLAEGQIQAQIDILNEDFSATNPNYNDTPAQWQAAAGNPEIQFCLAIVDPDGNPTNGITRDDITVTGTNASNNNIDDEIKPAVWWDSDEYYNIYVVAIPGTTTGGGTTGWAYYPTNGVIGGSLDGSVVDYRWFGGPGWGQSGYKTATHETGHYLGLPHTFDDKSCTEDDGISDTPNIDESTAFYTPGLSCNGGFPTGPSSCTNEHMYVNYMDYVNDDRCYTSFSNEQVNLMRSVLEGTAGGAGYGSRLPLTQNATTVCSFFDNDAGIAAIVEPASNQCGTGSITPIVTLQNFGANVLTTVTITYQVDGGTPVDFIWVDNLTSGGTVDVSLDPFIPPVGNYMFTAYTQLPNGGNDEQTSNDTMSVEPSAIVPIDLPLSENFEDIDFDPTVNGVFQFNPDDDDFRWERTLETSGFGLGTASTVFNNFEGTGGNNPGGTFDALITQIYDFTDVIGAELTFDVAYAPFDASFFDSLYVFASTDCGVTYDQVLYSDGNTGLATAPATTIMFTPTPNQWRTESIDLSDFDGFSSVSIAFINISGWGNRLFLDNINISPPCSLTLTMEQSNITCNGICDGIATVNATNGTGPFEYQWDGNAGNQTTATAQNLCFGTYNVTVSDNTGCSEVSEVTLTEPDLIVISTSVTNESAVDANDGIATASAAGGTGTLLYSWSNGEFGPMIDNLEPGVYTVSVFDDNQCVETATVTVQEYNCGNFNVIVEFSMDINCFGANNGEITVLASEGTPPYTFLWSNDGDGETETGLSPGVYTVTATDAAGCTASVEQTITEPAELTISATATDETAQNANDGTASASGDGGTGELSYLWSNGESTQNIDNLEPGTYTVIVTDENDCTNSATVTVNPYDCTGLGVEISSQNVSCNGASDGFASADPSDGTAPYMYLWSNGSEESAIQNLSPGTYIITVTDAAGCMITESVIITEPSPIIATLDITNETSVGANDGAITVNVEGGIPGGYIYQWIPNVSTTNTATNLEPGSYCIIITDINGNCPTEICGEVEPYICNFDIAVETTDANCVQGGTATALTFGGTEPFTYNWSTGENTQSIDGLDAGVYSLTVTDATNCELDLQFEIGNPAIITLEVTGTNETTPGANDGTATANVSGGSGIYDYIWSNGQVTQMISNLEPGNYNVTVTDLGSGCTAEEIIIIEAAEPDCTNMFVQLTTTSILCFGDSNGTATAFPAGGTAPYNYDWNTGGSSQTIDGLGEGIYIVTVTDAEGCIAIGEIGLEEPPLLEVTMSSTSETVPGANDGTASASPSGGTPAYTYQWNNGESTATISDLEAGIYTVTVMDANGCSTINEVEVGQGMITCFDFFVDIESTNVVCNGGANGTAVALPMNGTAPYQYEWSNGATLPGVTGLAPGFYTVTVIDAEGCEAVGEVFITEPDPIEISISATDATGPGTNDGTANASATGGTGSFTYEWNTGAMTATITDLEPGVYIVTVTDENQCVATESVEIEIEGVDCSNFIVEIETGLISCNGAEDGTATAITDGGEAPYSFSWNTGEETQEINNLGPGFYSVTIVDANGCEDEDFVQIGEPTPLQLVGNVSNESVPGANDGSIDLTVAGGTPGYSYDWSNGAMTEDINGLSEGSYTIIVTDENGCQEMLTLIVGVGNNDCNDFSVGSSWEDVSCSGDDDGLAIVTAIGGTPPFEYNWSNGATTQAVSGLIAGVYTVTVMDANDCTVVIEIEISEPEPLGISVSWTDETLVDANDGTAEANPFGGTGAYQYEWSNGETAAEIENLEPGVYFITVTDDLGCTAVVEVEIMEAEDDCGDFAAEIFSTPVSCFGDENGTASVDPISGIAPYEYTWNTGGTGSAIDGLSVGIYTVTVIDANSCELILEVEVGSPTALQVNVTGIDGSCGSDASALANPFGGTGPYEFMWSNGETDNFISELEAGVYTVTIIDANDCTTIGETAVEVDSEGVAIESEIDNVSCFGEHDGAIEIVVVQGTPPFTFEWNTGETTEDLEDLSPGVYTLFITDGAGCSFLKTFEISSPAELEVDIEWTAPSGGDGGTATAFASGGTTPYTYQWSNGSNNIMIENLNVGTYFVSVTDANGCEVLDSVNILMTGLPAINSLENIDVFPNPSSGELNIHAVFSRPEQIDLTIFNVVGQSVVNRSFEGTVLNVELNLEQQPAGTYFISLRSENGSLVRKLILVR